MAKTFKPGDVVDIRAQVTDVEADTGNITVEIACNKREYKHKVTLTGGQVTDAMTFVEKGELPEPDTFTIEDMFAKGGGVEQKVIEVPDTIGVKDKGSIG